jgi:hypothetical protein
MRVWELRPIKTRYKKFGEGMAESIEDVLVIDVTDPTEFVVASVHIDTFGASTIYSRLSHGETITVEVNIMILEGR